MCCQERFDCFLNNIYADIIFERDVAANSFIRIWHKIK